MAVDGIDIDIIKTAEILPRISKLNQDMTNQLNDIVQLFNIDEYWSSDAANELKGVFADIKNTVDVFHEQLGGYELFLKRTLEEYGITERTTKKNAETFY